MAWTAPMTFVANAALTAAQLNTHLRDNLMETEVAKVTAAGQYLVTTARNRVEARYPESMRIDTAERTASQDFVDLSTAGPYVTSNTGTKALVMIVAKIYQALKSGDAGATAPYGLDNAATGAAFAVSGATEIEPWDGHMIMTDGVLVNSGNRISNAVFLDTLNPGTNTFAMKYKVGNGAGWFAERVIIVIPF